MTVNKEKIRAAAMAATQGEWYNHIDIYAEDGNRVAIYNMLGREYFQNYNNATHITTSNPSTILSLLDAIDKAEKDAKWYRTFVEIFTDSSNLEVNNLLCDICYKLCKEDADKLFEDISVAESAKGGAA